MNIKVPTLLSLVLIVIGFLVVSSQTSEAAVDKFYIDYITKYGHFSKIDANLPEMFDKRTNAVRPDYIEYVANIVCETEEEFQLPKRCLLPFIRFESGFRTWATGLLQVRKDYHKCRFTGGKRANETTLKLSSQNTKTYKFVWGDDKDLVRYGAWLIKKALLEGRSLKSATQPWSVRSKALKEYYKIKDA